MIARVALRCSNIRGRALMRPGVMARQRETDADVREYTSVRIRGMRKVSRISNVSMTPERVCYCNRWLRTPGRGEKSFTPCLVADHVV